MKSKDLHSVNDNNTDDEIKDITITSISSFLNGLKIIREEECDHLKREYFFRGHANRDWKPIPGIYRHPEWIENEDLMIKDLISKCPNDFKEYKYTFQSLVKMQHYSLPTRLLDITTNPLIALYFSCQSEKIKTESLSEASEADGEVIIFKVLNECIKYYDSDTVSVISNIAKRPKDFDLADGLKAEEEIDAFNRTEKIKFLLHEIKHEKPHFESKIERAQVESVVFVRPLLNNPRIIKQEGAFILFGIDQKKTNPAKINDLYYPRKKTRILIPANEKSTIISELEVLGISSSTIFPEIDNVAKYIREKYQIAK